MVAGRDLDWVETVKGAAPHGCVPVRATDPLYILYTSGTTGRPKGVVRDNGGHAVALVWSMANVYDVHPGEVFWAASDVGWVVGHSYIVYAPLLAGSTTVLYEGKPVGTPDAGAFWRVIEQHDVAAVHRADRHARSRGRSLAGRARRRCARFSWRASEPTPTYSGRAVSSLVRWSTTGGRPRPAGRPPQLPRLAPPRKACPACPSRHRVDIRCRGGMRRLVSRRHRDPLPLPPGRSDAPERRRPLRRVVSSATPGGI
jgi:hypothetical protein